MNDEKNLSLLILKLKVKVKTNRKGMLSNQKNLTNNDDGEN